MANRKFGGVVAVAFFAGLTGALGAESPRSVAVSGSCVRSVVPDRGSVTVVVDVKEPEAKRAQVAATRQYEALRSKVSALKLPDGELTTSEYVSEEIREWEKNRMVSRGFHTRIGLRVETSDHARLGEVIDVASREGIKDVGELRNFVSTKKMLEEKMACLKEASEQARAKAEALAKALGAKVGDVLTVVESATPEAPPPQPMFRGAMMAADASMKAAPTIEPGKTELSTNVQVTFMLR